MSQIRRVKLAAIQAIKKAGGFERLANSRWRQERLLILCYHGISLKTSMLILSTLYSWQICWKTVCKQSMRWGVLSCLSAKL